MQNSGIRAERVLVTGATGFLGAAVAERLLAEGREVLGWIRPASDTWRLSKWLSHPKLRLVRGELGSTHEAVSSFRPQALLHAAWGGVTAKSREDPEQVNNVATSLSLLHLAASWGVSRFVGVGSQAEYGPHDGPIDEMAKAQPVSLYGICKLATGQIALALAQRLRLSAAWVRLFSAYGPKQPRGYLLPDFIEALRESRPFPLTGCAQRWDFLYIDDAASALVSLLDHPEAEGAFNLGAGEAVRLHDVVHRISKLVAPQREPEIGKLPYPPGTLMHLEANIDRLVQAVGWRPRVPLSEGLQRMVDGMDSQGARI